jgi:hypothetical protein
MITNFPFFMGGVYCIQIQCFCVPAQDCRYASVVASAYLLEPALERCRFQACCQAAVMFRSIPHTMLRHLRLHCNDTGTGNHRWVVVDVIGCRGFFGLVMKTAGMYEKKPRKKTDGGMACSISDSVLGGNLQRGRARVHSRYKRHNVSPYY